MYCGTMNPKKTGISQEQLETFIIHYSPLRDRFEYLSRNLSRELEANWINEDVHQDFNFAWREYKGEKTILGIPISRIAMDLGINSRSLIKPRSVAHMEGLVFLLISKVMKARSEINMGAIPQLKKLHDNLLQVTAMHLKALEKSRESASEWILVMEDDAILTEQFQYRLKEISSKKFRNPVWINLNSGAGLMRTRFDSKVNDLGLFRVRPPTTRCTTAYLLNKKYVIEAIKSFRASGVPDFLPIDVIYQIMNRAIGAKAFWSEPSIVIQGSESGNYGSRFNDLRKRHEN